MEKHPKLDFSKIEVRTKTVEYKFPTFASQLADLPRWLRMSNMGNVRFPLIDLLSGRTKQELILVNNDSLFYPSVIRILTRDLLLKFIEKGYIEYQEDTLDTRTTLIEWVEIFFGDMSKIKNNKYTWGLKVELFDEGEIPSQYEDPSMEIGFEEGVDQAREYFWEKWWVSKDKDN